MIRRSTLLVAATLTLALPCLALAQKTPAQQADDLNEAGKGLYKNNDFAGAAGKFREAIALSAEARFYFNLRATLEKAGDYAAALEACDNAYTDDPTDAHPDPQPRGRNAGRGAGGPGEVQLGPRRRDRTALRPPHRRQPLQQV